MLYAVCVNVNIIPFAKLLCAVPLARRFLSQLFRDRINGKSQKVFCDLLDLGNVPQYKGFRYAPRAPCHFKFIIDPLVYVRWRCRRPLLCHVRICIAILQRQNRRFRFIERFKTFVYKFV